MSYQLGKVKELNIRITESIRTISNSNIPGVPHQYKELIDDAQESIQNVMAKLEEETIEYSGCAAILGGCTPYC